MPWRTTFHNTVTTPLPSDIDPVDIITLLHDHSYLIHTQPIVTRFSPQPPESDGTIRYDVWETIQLLPCGAWPHEIHFTCAFRDTRDGVVSHVDAPMGLGSDAVYSVRRWDAGDGEEGGSGRAKVEGGTEDESELRRLEHSEWVLQEEIRTECNVIFKPLVQGTMVPVRKKMHDGMIATAREMQSRRVGQAGY